MPSPDSGGCPSAHALGLQDGSETGRFAVSRPSAHALGLQDGSETGRFAVSRPWFSRRSVEELSLDFNLRNPRRHLPPTARKPESGFTILELLMTAVLVTAGLFPLLQALSVGLFAAGNSENRIVAVNLAREKMEEIKNKSYSNISSESKAAVSGFSSYQREVAVTTPQTDLKQIAVSVYWYNKDDELSLSVVTYASNL